MKRWGKKKQSKFPRVFVFTVLAVLGLGFLKAAEGEAVPVPAASATPPRQLKPLSVPLPIGQKSKGLKIPQFNLAGQMLSQLLAGQVQRVDDEFLRIEQLKLDLYDDNGTSEFLIDLPSSLFSTKTRVLTSEEPVSIHHKDFDLTGARLEFNTATRKGRLFGPVTMKIRDLDRVAQKSVVDPPAALAPSPAAAPEK